MNTTKVKQLLNDLENDPSIDPFYDYFEEFDDELERQKDIAFTRLQAAIDDLTPASRKLWTVINRSPHALSRVEIVQAMGRSKVSPHDINQLNAMVKSGLLHQRRQRRQIINGYPSGYYLVYFVPTKIKNAIKELRRRKNAPPNPTKEERRLMMDAEIAALEAELDQRSKGWLSKLVEGFLKPLKNH